MDNQGVRGGWGELGDRDRHIYIRLSVQKTKIVASSPITSWQIEREKVETVTDFIFVGSEFTVDGDCNHEIKRCLLFGRKVMTNLDSILKAETLLCQQRSV